MKTKMEDVVDLYPQVLAWDGIYAGDRAAMQRASDLVGSLLPPRAERDWSIADLRYEYYNVDKEGFYRRKT